MIKKIITGLFAFAAIFFITSCQECIECYYEDSNGKVHTSGNTCGTKEEVEDVREEWETIGEVYDVEVTCE